MSSIDFQNGFICGMATKGLTRSGEYYKPLVWNDEGIYNYFYIDFKKSMEDFTLGMLQESIIVHDTVQLPITNLEKVSSSIYKIYCDITNKRSGITILNKKTSLLAFEGGQQLPIFSIHIYINGQDKYERFKYMYQVAKTKELKFPEDIETNVDVRLRETEWMYFYESIINTQQTMDVIERNVEIIIIGE